MAAPNDSKSPTPIESPIVAASKPSGGGFKAWLPVLAAIVLAPAASFAVAQFVLVPRLRAQLTAAPADPSGRHVATGESATPSKEDEKGHAAAGNYEFSNIVVNLAGTMGTRYLKVSFIVTGAQQAPTKPVFEAQKAKLTDVTLNVLSSLSLADLEEPGSKNVLREKLVSAYNQTLGQRVVEQVYFVDFVVQ